MARALLGGILGGVAMWFIGFIFWGTPLNRLAFSVAPDSANAAIQSTLAAQLGPSGTGVYSVPWPGTQAGSYLYAQGPTALIQFNTHGFAVVDSASLVGGLVLGIIAAVLVAFALRTVSTGLSFGGRLTLVGLFAIAIPAYTDLGQIVFNHAPAGYFIYLFFSDMLAFLAAGAIIAWMLPNAAVEPVASYPPTEV
ncbi:hypothetical protein [Sphingomonas sp.]|uniref:hypothetical protein n=1 Tax=Sphingomonas sp. TaxID=28214 RepID=UPI002BCFBF39|nr:hypothetical protein [Sphingomonas sp.]HWK36448.1 hypothetical protein [Sphingomonas sp.]